MKVAVINGSPKGKYSITLQTVNYLERVFPTAELEVLHVGRTIRALEKDMSAAVETLLGAELLLFVYPVYTFIAPYQLHRFIELLKESGADLSGKYAAQLTTSKHFYDVTAHRFIQDNCADLKLKYIGGLSADMDDLLGEDGRKQARDFMRYIRYCIQNDIYEVPSAEEYSPEHISASVPEAAEEKTSGDVVIVTNRAPEDERLAAMTERFRAVLPRRTRVINIAEYPFQGGCLGCFNCAVSGKCVYKDSFDEFLRTEIQSAQAIVYAFSIKDHSMGASFKLYDDRQFCNGHRTVTMGMPVGYIVSGSYSKEPNLQMIIEGRAQVGGNFLSGVATDEADTDAQLDALAKKLDYALKNDYAPPKNFYGVGGMKIFRDLIWQMQGMMKADHKFYKKHKQYDFPQKRPFDMLKMYLVGALLSNESVKKKMGNMMNEGMLMPYKKVIDNLDELNGKKNG